ncbi:MAG: CocE/NonD family hydrolase [Gemmatimonadales bacterium]
MRVRHLLLRGLVAVAILSVIYSPLVTAAPPRHRAVEYDRRELRIPMRDGVTLFAVALVPKGTREPLPIILIRTPFNAAREFSSAVLPASLEELGEDGYIFVTEDVRGRGASEGEFVTNRPQADAKDPRGVDESTDAWDTIDWLVKRLPGNSGRVGVMGISYRGWLAGMAGVHPHPALKAISPQAPMSDTWLGDDFFHQGAFRQTQGVLYSAYIEGKNGLSIPDADEFQFYLRLGTLDSIAKFTGVFDLPSWTGFRTHPAHDAYWDARAMSRVLTRAEVPTLFVGGWWDEEDILGPQLGYRAVERHDPKNWNRIVLGPWSHGSWSRPGGDSLGAIRFGSNTADYFRMQIQRPWFAFYLHGNGEGRFPEVWAFESGGNRWRTFERWPPKSAVERKLYLRANGALSFTPPPAAPRRAMEFDSFRADPANPVPYVPRPVNGEGWSNWLQQDQRFVEGRPDVLTWVSAPLTEDVTIVGNVAAHLFASTTGSDADWVVKLIDVYPETVSDRPTMGGYQLMVNADILRGRYWKGFDRATAIPSNKVIRFTIDLHEQLYRFQKGHRLMVQVQSSWFPLYDRNPQRFIPNIFNAKTSDFQVADHRIWRSARYPSHLAVRVLP